MRFAAVTTCAGLLGAAAAAAAASVRVAPVPCPFGSLYCTDLIAPPDVQGVSGTLELEPAASPFGAAVTADGRPRYLLIAHVEGLPEQAPPAPHYVAWAYTLSMDSVVRLGDLHNGRTALGELDREQFRILITAERGGGTTRSGKIVLRGTSPGARLLAHRDIVQPIAPGAVLDAVPFGDSRERPDRGRGGASGPGFAAPTWRAPPTPMGMPTMPGMEHLEPAVAPWMPGGADWAVPSKWPEARRRRSITVKDGDTLDLDARIVRRSVGGGGGGGGGGRSVVMYGFNGEIPGPLIRAPRGATLTVRFRNHLDQPSSIHWHGVRLDNAFDGVPDVTQPAVEPGGEFTYRVHFRDAGVYWYHPHVREDEQQSLGLFGNILVSSPDPKYYERADREEVLALDDLLMDDRGVLPYGSDGVTNALMGRWGNVYLVNGEPGYQLTVRRGEVVRFFLTNVSNARVYNLSFGHGTRMKLVASDAGKFEHEEWVENVVIAPAERYVVDVRFEAAGTEPLVNRVQALDHMYGTYSLLEDTLGIVQVLPRAKPASGGDYTVLRRNADVAADLAPYRRFFDSAPAHELVLDLRTKDLPRPVSLMLNALNAPMDWNDGMAGANWVSTSREVTWVLRDKATGKENMDIHWRFAQGDVAKIRLFNDPGAIHAMAHPIHIHGQRFLVLERNGVRNPNLVWKDTAIIPAGQTVDLLVDFSNPGQWVLHCHIAEHMESGMMMQFEVR